MVGNNYPCRNFYCRLNNCGACDAEHMVNLMCSGKDIYDQCKEKEKGEELIKAIEKIAGRKLTKNRKIEVGYYA